MGARGRPAPPPSAPPAAPPAAAPRRPCGRAAVPVGPASELRRTAPPDRARKRTLTPEPRSEIFQLTPEPRGKIFQGLDRFGNETGVDRIFVAHQCFRRPGMYGEWGKVRRRTPVAPFSSVASLCGWLVVAVGRLFLSCPCMAF